MATYKCAGRNRTDDAGEPICNYEAPRPWRGRCPKCGKTFNVIKFGVERTRKTEVTSAASDNPEIQIKYIPTSIKVFDDVIGGGVVLSQSILLGGEAGSGKTSLALLVADGLTKQTKRPMLFCSAEQGDDAVLAMCKRLGVKNEQIKIRGEARHIGDILQRCTELKPYLTVFDSLHAIASGSNMGTGDIAKLISEYCGKSKMIAIVVAHLTKALSFKGDTGPSYYLDTLMSYEPYMIKVDGDPIRKFGKNVAKNTIGYNEDMEARGEIPHMRVLIGGYMNKNRYGAVGKKTYIMMDPNSGELVHIPEKPKLALVGDPEED